METLRNGDRGAIVAELQKYLGIYQDGVFGISTEIAVREYQIRHGLTSDGVVGIYMWELLRGGGRNE